MSRLFPTFPIPPIGAPTRDDPYYRLTSDGRIRLFATAIASGPGGLRILRNLPAANTDGEFMGVRWESAPRPHKYMMLLVRYQMNEVSPEYDNQKPYPNHRSRRKQMDSDYHKYLYELCINMKRRGELPPPEGERIHLAGLKEFVSWLEMLDIESNSADLE
ncbi:uncharacterized protein BO72DRAFT_526995 [Aspergillus fijiensis CBS 313.89]|uniref:Uncharacterized protein n=1 Tax=Aspergillus fijiensis CBS 313.89 TaxID=1448319 RepID=A0A8G1VZF4_9EURO|nr:uncharacterized protein BO72DRAFT_526995 [Aspergillus fijiensis CBS 313.89]RAK78227.1 hypothetical protein BO72DRAFT_526995 [Aspergillus fijiensis CBS 313.89]